MYGNPFIGLLVWKSFGDKPQHLMYGNNVTFPILTKPNGINLNI